MCLKCVQQPASPLHLAAGNQDEALMSLFLEHGLSINLADVTGRTPLHFALRSQKKTLSFIRFLVKHGADATAVDQSGQGALHCALKVQLTH
jgi:ankyrin repeat protein